MGIFVGSGFMWVMLKNPSLEHELVSNLMTLLEKV